MAKKKDRSFAAKVAKAGKGTEERVETALVLKPVPGENGSYKFKRIRAKLTKETREALGI